MQRYWWLTWRHSVALAAFVRAKRSLEKILTQFHAESSASWKRDAEYQAKIKEEEEARNFIDSQRELIVKQITSIDKILSPQ